MSDPYDILGITKHAASADIRAAFRRLAKQYHPDLNNGDDTKFKQVNQAFEILGDTDKKAQYDCGEIDGTGNPTMSGFQGAQRQGQRGAFQYGGDIFGRKDKRPQKGNDARFKLSIDFMEAVKGAKKKIRIQGDVLNLSIPVGLKDGQSLRLQGKGGQGYYGGKAGDIYVDVTVLPHKFYRREGRDIHLDVPVSLYEALNGLKLRIPTIHGKVSVTIPAGLSTGQVMRIKGKGIKPAKARPNEIGDMILHLQIDLPVLEKKDVKAISKLLPKDSPRPGFFR